MEDTTLYISIIFGLILFLSVFTFYIGVNNPGRFLIMTLGWIFLQTGISVSGFYEETETFPLRIVLLVVPPVLSMLWLFFSARGKSFLDNINIHMLIVIHVVRAPIELVIFWLFICKAMPYEMTFGGGNLDIISGLTVPLIYYLGIMRGKIRWKILLVWNLVCLGLLLNVVLKSTLAAPFFSRAVVFGQPNIAMLHFPFVLLPGVIVPILLCAHLAVIRKLLKVYWFEFKNTPYIAKRAVKTKIACHENI
jgi:hypothetical protein